MSEIILMRVTSNDRLIFVVETRDLNKSRKTDDKMKRRKKRKNKNPQKTKQANQKEKKTNKKTHKNETLAY